MSDITIPVPNKAQEKALLTCRKFADRLWKAIHLGGDFDECWVGFYSQVVVSQPSPLSVHTYVGCTIAESRRQDGTGWLEPHNLP